MRQHRRIYAMVSFLIVSAMVINHAFGLSNKILAVVNDEVVTQAELDVALTPVAKELKEEFSGKELDDKIEEMRQEFLNQLVEDKLILQEARRKGITADEAKINEKLKDVQMKFSSATDFDKEIEKVGMTIAILRNRYKEQIMMAELVTREIRDKIVVTPTEVDDYYKTHLNDLKTPDSAHLRGIMIRFDETNTEALAKQKAQDVYRFAKEGRDFADLAKQYSEGAQAAEGGDMGFIFKGQMREEFDKVIFSLNPQEVSEPIETDTGFYLFKVEEKKDDFTPPLSEVRGEIENILFREKAQKKYQEWIAKLKRDAFIQFK